AAAVPPQVVADCAAGEGHAAERALVVDSATVIVGRVAVDDAAGEGSSAGVDVYTAASVGSRVVGDRTANEGHGCAAARVVQAAPVCPRVVPGDAAVGKRDGGGEEAGLLVEYPAAGRRGGVAGDSAAV